MYSSDTYNWQLVQQKMDCRNLLYEVRYYGQGDFTFKGILEYIDETGKSMGYYPARFAAMCRQTFRYQGV